MRVRGVDRLKLGMKINMLTIIGLKTRKRKDGLWTNNIAICKCDCGNIVEVKAGSLITFHENEDGTFNTNISNTNNDNISCGCHINEDYTGYIINGFELINKEELPYKRHGKVALKYHTKCIYCGEQYCETITGIHRRICDCKKEKKIKTTDKISIIEIANKYNLSYGSVSTIASKWYNMHRRCYNPKCEQYKYYGGRGIKICDEWYKTKEGFETFFKWIIDSGYDFNKTEREQELDRINCDGGYSPDNCRLITHKENMNNRHNYGYLDDVI